MRRERATLARRLENFKRAIFTYFQQNFSRTYGPGGICRPPPIFGNLLCNGCMTLLQSFLATINWFRAPLGIATLSTISNPAATIICSNRSDA